MSCFMESPTFRVFGGVALTTIGVPLLCEQWVL